MLASGPIDEPADMIINMTAPRANFSVEVSYDRSLVLTSLSAAEPLRTVATTGGGRTVMTLTAPGGVSSGEVARLSFVRVSSGSLTLVSLVEGLEAVCIGCQWYR